MSILKDKCIYANNETENQVVFGEEIDEYLAFWGQFNEKFYEGYKKLVNSLPKKVLKKLAKMKQFEAETDNYSCDFSYFTEDEGTEYELNFDNDYASISLNFSVVTLENLKQFITDSKPYNVAQAVNNLANKLKEDQ